MNRVGVNLPDFKFVDRYTLWGYNATYNRYTPMGYVIIGGVMDEKKVCECCYSEKTKERSADEKKDLMTRLKRIEGQVRGVEGMLEKDAYCTDILMQVSAITAALNSFNKQLISSHIRTCVADNIRNGNDEVVDELVTALQKLMK